MGTDTLSVTFDGYSDVNKLTGQAPAEWLNKSMTAYSVWYGGPKEKFVLGANLTGSNWNLKYLRAGSEDNKLILNDLDGNSGREIRFLEVGFNSDVDLISTDVRYIRGWDGEKHEITLGNSMAKSVHSINLFAAENIVTTGNTRVSSIQTGLSSSDADRAVGDTIVIGSGGAGSVQTAVGKDSVTTTTKWVESIFTGDNDDTVTIGSGSAGSVRTSDGDDQVFATKGWAELISTGAGDDLVRLGDRGGYVRMGSGDDTVKFSDLKGSVVVIGSTGSDTLDFSKLSAGVTFTLNSNGAFQDVTGTVGKVSEQSMDNIIGTEHRDILTGNSNANILVGGTSSDVLRGGRGDDTLSGGSHKDRLIGGNGLDTLKGGKGRDTLIGGKDDDVLRGGSGADVFVFGAQSGVDTVQDFGNGADVLRIIDHKGGFAALIITDLGADLKVLHDGGVIVLTGEAGTTLTGEDFDFI